MPLKKGDFVLIDYIGKVKETGEAFDTTIEKVAKDERLYKEGEIYEPKLVVLGEGWVLKTLDESLETMIVGKETSVEISSEKAFGDRDPEKVKRVPLRQLTNKGISPGLGKRVEYNGKMATIRTMGAGRVLLDFNPPLAGKTLVYRVTVQKRLRTNKQRMQALIHRRIPAVEQSKFKFTIKTRIVSVEMPEEAFYLEGIQLAKRGTVMDIKRFFPKITFVKFIETFKTESEPRS
ncbi:peptidylprolyl isomerase [Candidatus Bathyarchaeota archaeon]|nr:peptidylprolyl isomerase [Candidatus Bathyarchaeota archaeon]